MLSEESNSSSFIQFDMLGAIIGDIVGSKYEFNNTLDYDFEMFAEGSDFTDDSICTVAVADAILKGKTYKDSLLE